MDSVFAFVGRVGSMVYDGSFLKYRVVFVSEE